jgi:DNA processing protein
MTTAALLTARAAPELAHAPPDDLPAWLRLAHARGLRPAALRALLGAFGGPQAVLAQSFAALAGVAGEDAAKAVLAPPPDSRADFDERVQRTVDWASEAGNHVVTLADAAYPQALLTMPDPPPLLYVKGRLDLLQARAVAIVGSRSATPQGIEDARRFARALSDAGLAVVSGLALGIDAAAHRGALQGAASTLAVIGTGADLVYPSQHHALAHDIAERGAIVSEWPLGTPARPENFPQRNRLIAGLVRGVLIVEAAMRSGSLITARLANEMGRDVFAIPGSIHAPLSRGCHRMIKQGAKLVETPEEVLEEFGIAPAAPAATAARKRSGAAANNDRPRRAEAPPPTTASWASASARATSPNPTPDEDRVLAALGHSPTTLEILASRTDLTGSTLQGLLLRLELAGHIETLPGGRFTRIERS